jgi:hypothetical protein
MTTHHIGHHLATVESDLMFYEIQGDLSGDEIRQGVDLLGPVVAEHGHCYLIANLTHMGKLDVDARRQAAHHPHLKRVRGYAGVSTSIVTRTLVTLALRAVTIFQKSDMRISFFATEAEARQWIDRLRSEATAAT